jgi:hypothetical protein
MKPLNTDDPGCNYTTSNCVIWQGPDIPCIKLCKGDTVSDVIYKLATELCTIMDVLKIEAYDLSCFNLTACKPADFQQLIQFILGRICGLEECTGCVPNCEGQVNPPAPTPGPGAGCPDCVMNVASCFYYTNEFGDLVTTMQLQDYVTAIGNAICNNVQGITQQQRTLNNHEERIVVLEKKSTPEFQLPMIVPTSVLPPVPTEMDVVLEALEMQFGQLRSATGMPNEIYQNIAKQAVGLNQEKTLSGTGATMAALPGWASVVNNLAQAIGNIQLTISDIRQAIKTIQLNCCPTGCEGIELSLYANLTGDVLNVYATGIIPSGFVQCSGSTKVTITDSQGGSTSFTFNLINALNVPTGTAFNLLSTPINTSLDLTVVMEPCLSNGSTNSTCQSYLSYTVVNNANCPDISYSTGQGSIAYSFQTTTGDFTYNVQLWDALGSTMIVNQIWSTTGIQTINGQFAGLTANTIYKVRVSIQATACPECEPVVCPFTTVITNPPTCPAPESVSAGLTIP